MTAVFFEIRPGVIIRGFCPILVVAHIIHRTPHKCYWNNIVSYSIPRLAEFHNILNTLNIQILKNSLTLSRNLPTLKKSENAQILKIFLIRLIFLISAISKYPKYCKNPQFIFYTYSAIYFYFFFFYIFFYITSK